MQRTQRRYKKSERGYKNGIKKRRVHSPKPPCYNTALLFPLDIITNFHNIPCKIWQSLCLRNISNSCTADLRLPKQHQENEDQRLLCREDCGCNTIGSEATRPAKKRNLQRKRVFSGHARTEKNTVKIVIWRAEGTISESVVLKRSHTVMKLSFRE